MGMFDYIYFSVDKLPLSDEQNAKLKDECGGEFQTKDLDCNLDNIFLLKDDTLAITDASYEARNSKRIPLIYTGTINFYTTVDNPEGRMDWYEFKATFNSGKLLEVVRVDEKESTIL